MFRITTIKCFSNKKHTHFAIYHPSHPHPHPHVHMSKAHHLILIDCPPKCRMNDLNEKWKWCSCRKMTGMLVHQMEQKAVVAYNEINVNWHNIRLRFLYHLNSKLLSHICQEWCIARKLLIFLLIKYAWFEFKHAAQT